MGQKAIAVIGEGITEKFYIEALKKLSSFTVKPQELGNKASSLKKLEKSIMCAVKEGFDEVYCLIDMDGKRTGKSKIDYISLKQKYHNIVHQNKSKGISCKVVFIETERCTELWFLFHFIEHATTREFSSYKELESELRKYLPNYEKTDKYFRVIRNIQNEIEHKGGELEKATRNAESSIKSRDKDQRDYTYSEIYLLIDALIGKN